MISPCPVCESSDTEPWIEARSWDHVPDSVGAGSARVPMGDVWVCSVCGHGFRVDAPGPEELAAAYRDMDGTVYRAERTGRERTARTHAKLLGAPTGDRRLLDVGCATGLFLQEAERSGWLPSGVEPSRTLCEEARTRLGPGVEVHEGTLSSMPAATRPSDVVTAWDVLEHVTSPSTFLGDCAALVRPGGLVALNVPDRSSLQARLFGRRWPLLLPAHLHYFTPRSLTRALENTGLRVRKLGRRSAWFSLEYLMTRLGEHGIPGAARGARVVSRIGAEGPLLPLRMGEIFALAERPESAS